MPLPDANKRSPRVYTNLQNLDLDNVTFANVQATGNPINVEEANEDELRRLVLVNLARLVTAGEWTGLLEAGGGTISPTAMKSQSYNSTRDQYVLGNGVVWELLQLVPPWGRSCLGTTTLVSSISSRPTQVT